MKNIEDKKNLDYIEHRTKNIKKEGGYNVENMIFEMITNYEKMAINQVLFVLNKNNCFDIDRR